MSNLGDMGLGKRRRKSTAKFTYEEFKSLVCKEQGFAAESSILRIRRQLSNYVKNGGGYR